MAKPLSSDHVQRTWFSTLSIKIEDKFVGQIKEVGGHFQVDSQCVPDLEDNENASVPVFNIPSKFRHVNLENMPVTLNEIEELKTVLRTIHPWSSLHFGYTALDTILRLYTKTIKSKLGQDCEIQILTPQVRGSLGAVNLNRHIQETVNPTMEGKVQYKIGEKYFRTGDRVIQNKNNYELNVFNGDIGTIISIDTEDYCCRVRFENQNRIVTYQKEDFT